MIMKDRQTDKNKNAMGLFKKENKNYAVRKWLTKQHLQVGN